MEYREKHIEDKIYTTQCEAFKLLDSNDFDLTIEDLEEYANALKKKEKELKESGVEFKDLRMNFYATEYYESDYGDQDAECSVSITWEIPETDKEANARIEREKKRIDKEIEAAEEKEERRKIQQDKNVKNAIELLKQQGYTITHK